MNTKPTDEEYYQRHTNIRIQLLQAYLDKYILNSIDQFKSSIPKDIPPEISGTVFVIAHICDLAKKDLALTLWKVFYDDGKDANTIKKLRQYLFEHYGIKYRITETENVKKIRKLISAARNGFIAHNLLDDDGRVLQISDLIDALQDIRAYYNDLSFDTVDARVNLLTDAEIYGLSFFKKVGLDLMLHGFLNSHGDTSYDWPEVP